MTRTTIPLALLLLTIPVLSAQQGATARDPEDLLAAFDKAHAEWSQAYLAASKAGDRVRMNQLRSNPPHSPFLRKFAAAAKTAAGTPAEIGCLVWLCQYDGGIDAKMAYAETLAQSYADSQHLGPVALGHTSAASQRATMSCRSGRLIRPPVAQPRSSGGWPRRGSTSGRRP